MKELVESVRQHGLLQPLVCYRDGENGEDLWLVAGTRRLFAAKEAGLKTVPVTVRAGLTQDEILDIQLEENLQREALDPIDEWKYLAEYRGKCTIEELAKRIGKSPGHIAQRIALAKRLIPPVHHIDGDPMNNDGYNLLALCQRCHLRLDMPLKLKRRRSRWICGHIVALAIIAAAGCARITATRAPDHEVSAAAAPAPILRTVMWSTLFCDVGDPEWRLKMRALHDMNIRGASGLLMICRPRFCEYAWDVVPGTGAQGSSDAIYDLMRINQRWLAHVSEVVDYANSFEPPFALQFDFLPHPTLRSHEHMVFKALRMLLAPVSLMQSEEAAVGQEGIHDDLVFTARRNVQGITARGTELFEQTPTGAWAEVSRNWLRATVPIINRARFGAVLFVLERTGSENCERWYWNEALAAGLSPAIHVITNARMGGAIHSPHLHSVSAFRKSARYTYCSSDGWEPNAKEWRQCIDAQAAKGSPAIELWRKEFSDGSGGGNYGKRTRPSAEYIARTCGAVLVEAGR